MSRIEIREICLIQTKDAGLLPPLEVEGIRLPDVESRDAPIVCFLAMISETIEHHATGSPRPYNGDSGSLRPIAARDSSVRVELARSGVMAGKSGIGRPRRSIPAKVRNLPN